MSKNNHTKRPVSITIIAWCLVLFALGFFAFTLVFFVGFGGFHHFPFSFQDVINVFVSYKEMFGTFLPLSHLINIIGALGILKQKNWERFLSLASVFSATVFSLVDIYVGGSHCSSICLIQMLGFTFCVFYFLLTKQANQYFTGNPNQWFL